MIEALFYTLALLALFHFIYDGVVAPDLRMTLRYDLFALRDRIIDAYAAGEIDDDVFDVMHHEINAAITILPDAGVVTLWRVLRMLKDDEELASRVEKAIATLDSSSHPLVPDMRKQVRLSFDTSMAVNLGGWWLLIIPVILWCVCIAKVREILLAALYVHVETFKDFAAKNDSDGTAFA